MADLVNFTPFAATCIPSMSKDDDQLVVVVVTGRFLLPPAGVPSVEPIAIAEDQAEVPLADLYGDEEEPLLKREGQAAYTRPATDVYLVGTAWAPGGKPATQSSLGLRVGPLQKGAVVFGDRVWTHHLTLGPSKPVPFASIPITYARCFGGNPTNPSRSVVRSAQRNPAGRGLHNGEREALGQPMPNFEDPRQLLSSAADRPAPCGFGPVARHWWPRREYGGTYDQAWVDARLPLWPVDLDTRYFQAAAAGLQATPHLAGDEPVRIVGASPDGAYTFTLPRYRLQVRFESDVGAVRKPMVLDGVEFDTDVGLVSMTWRVALTADPLTLGGVVVRVVEPWEADG